MWGLLSNKDLQVEQAQGTGTVAVHMQGLDSRVLGMRSVAQVSPSVLHSQTAQFISSFLIPISNSSTFMDGSVGSLDVENK